MVLATPLARALASLPQAVLLRLAVVVAWMATPLLRRRRRIAAINLALCFPDSTPGQLRALLRANLHASVIGLFELLRAWFAPSARLQGMARIDGLEHLRDALARGEGVLLLTAHFTSTELAARLLSEAAGIRVRGVVRRNNSACLESWLEAARTRVFGATLAKKDVRGLLRALQAGEVVMYSADQNFNYQHAFVPFFGIEAATLTGTPELIRRAGARMLVFFFHRRPDGVHHLRIAPAWPGWMEGSPPESAAIYMRELEAEVRAHPEQYLWLHRRFKTRPPGQPDPYR